MKIRTDFVTNSSSSSYIIAFKPFPDLDDEILKKYPFLQRYSQLIKKILLSSDGYGDTTEGEVYSTLESLNEHFIDNYGYYESDTIETLCEDDADFKQEYENYKKYLDEGYSILMKRVSTHDELFPSLISELSNDNENFIIIESGE